MNQPPFLIIKWPQRSQSRVRSTFFNPAESGIELTFYRAGARACLSAIGAPSGMEPLCR